MPTVRAHAAQDGARAAYSAKLDVFYGLQTREAAAYSAYAATTTFLPSCVAAAVLYYGGTLVLSGQVCTVPSADSICVRLLRRGGPNPGQYLVKHGQTWSNMVKHGQTWSNFSQPPGQTPLPPDVPRRPGVVYASSSDPPTLQTPVTHQANPISSFPDVPWRPGVIYALPAEPQRRLWPDWRWCVLACGCGCDCGCV